MRVDAYTKTILTVIAAALVWMYVRDLTPLVHAQAKGQPVTLAGVSFNPGNPIPVMLVGVKRHKWTVNAELGKPYEESFAWEPIAVSSVGPGKSAER